MANPEDKPTLKAVRAALHGLAEPERVKVLSGFFKTGPGQYGEGDVFIGVRMPALRTLTPMAARLADLDLARLLAAKIHEERMLGVVALVHRYQKGDPAQKEAAFRLYVDHRSGVNSWDLVDGSAPAIAGCHFSGKPAPLLDGWVAHGGLWERRIAMVSTHWDIRRGEFGRALDYAEKLMGDPHDLMHKAVGWMLREVGKKDVAALEGFLRAFGPQMARTTLRYAIERFPPKVREAYLKGAKM
ncbi:MAG: DNA alkylation repair protein [Deltaproteobacteria bacterium]|nr:DNA alkylation repair protein [Deltaproteobacteria bacterium]